MRSRVFAVSISNFGRVSEERRQSAAPCFVVLAILLTVLLAPTHAGANGRPNVVFFLVDDLGWADLGCFGSDFHQTPHIDALCASGMKFTQGYAACPVCSPTRASILTGRHPVRVDITDWLPGMRTPKGSKFLHVSDREDLALEEVTLAEELKRHGYQTFFAGKWHLGDAGHFPEDQGFDVNVGGCSKGSPPGGYYAPWRNPRLKAEAQDEYLTERLTQESIRFLRQRNEKQPFLLYLSYYNVHTPITPYRKRLAEYVESAKQFESPAQAVPERSGVSRGRQDNPEYASMVAAVDDSVGALLAELQRLSLADNTIVCFFSDNGGLCTKPQPGPTCNLPLRAGKGWLYEGGIREPMIIRAPGVTMAGSVCESPVCSMDFFPTILELAGLPLQPQLHQDGRSLKPLLAGGTAPARSLYWHYPHYHGSTWKPGAAIREGDWKLIEFYEYGDFELYNLKEDVGERNNLADTERTRAVTLRSKLSAWQQQMGAKLPQRRK